MEEEMIDSGFPQQGFYPLGGSWQNSNALYCESHALDDHYNEYDDNNFLFIDGAMNTDQGQLRQEEKFHR